ncbi:metallophosphoesterase [Thermus composti]|uniref:Metallophosphoesterase n=1 Tax=Thermus composti TaxID=532059 RepID=A0ABV6Q1E7_9DEIN|nr:metallophosphoesterase [Thermus composti]GGM97924.1 metallophosphoesterase [Thermus composti]
MRVVAIGDLHANFPAFWRVLRREGLLDEAFRPSLPLLRGEVRVVLLGDLVHPKTLRDYERLTGLSPFDPQDPTHLRVAAGVEIRELFRLKALQEEVGGGFAILLGNHDEAALKGEPILGTRHLKHLEFHLEAGGRPLPETLKAWIRGFPRELLLQGVHFAHVGPVPWLQEYDALFYAQTEPKTWWFRTPDYVERMGYRYGVYGHTPMKEGILLKERFALIDALDLGEYLVLDLEADPPRPEVRRLHG